MRKAYISLALAVISVLTLSFVMSMTNASSISVGTYDATGMEKDTFAGLEPVRIIAQSTKSP